VGLVLVVMPLQRWLSPPAWTAMALMLACPSAPLILFRVRSSGGTAELAARLQISAALLAIVTIPLLEGVFRAAAALQGWETRGWGISPDRVAVQVLQVQVLPVLAGVLLRLWQPELARRCSRLIGHLATVLLLGMLVALLLLSGRQLLPFLQANLVALAGMAVLCALSLAIGYGLAGADGRERRTVALVTGMRNTGLAAQLALTYGRRMPGLIPGILGYVLVTVIVTSLFLLWQKRELEAPA
jgi:predicted Na+-dependent transporter